MRSWPLAIGVLAIGVAVLAGWLWVNGDGIEERSGTQIRSPEVTIGDAESRPWNVLVNEARVVRPDFPRPLVAQDAQLCFGFERLDFGDPIRPSLARCVQREALRTLPENGIASIFVIKAGLDTWHVIASGTPVDGINVVSVDGVELSDERIFIGDGVLALRLPDDIRIETISWTRGRFRYRCDAPHGAADSGTFCT